MLLSPRDRYLVRKINEENEKETEEIKKEYEEKLTQKDQEISQKDQEISQKDQEIMQIKNELKNNNIKIAKKLNKEKIPIEVIEDITGIAKDEIIY